MKSKVCAIIINVIIIIACTMPSISATAQTTTDGYDRFLLDLLDHSADTIDTSSEDAELLNLLIDNIVENEADSVDTIYYEPMHFLPPVRLPLIAFMPVVFDSLAYIPPRDFNDPTPYLEGKLPELDWVRIEANRQRLYREVKQNYMVKHPRDVHYNLATLPEPPKKYKVVVDPTKSTITITEEAIDKSTLAADAATLDVKPKNWLHAFDGSLQFSQAYISPNWYQGGNNNVNAIGNFIWNVKLNDKFHPNLMAEATAQYKLAISSAPQDTVRSYRISEDLFQFNGKFGVKAFNHWFYSVTTMFKTQLLNNYKPNTDDLTAAFMSPAEWNLGVGMTYNYTNPKKTLTLGASIAPLSYNMKICTNRRMDETSFGIREGRKTVSEIGSNAEVKLTWNIIWNISYRSRLFLFTDYSYLQGDWENTFDFSINRYLSTQLYIHVRYDSSTPRLENSDWHRWQLKEILSFGFQYKFRTV